MSVVVKHMQMPSECLKADESINRNCPMDRVWCADKFAPYDMTYLQRLEEQTQKLPSWCPLRPLPEKHGRMGDLDAIMNKLAEDKRDAFTKHDVWLMLSKHGATTIIEAEGGSDE